MFSPLAIKGIIGAVALVICATLFFRYDAALDRTATLEREIRFATGKLELKDGDIVDEIRDLGRDRVRLNELKRQLEQEAAATAQNREIGLKASRSAVERASGYEATAIAADASARTGGPNAADCGPSELVKGRWKLLEGQRK